MAGLKVLLAEDDLLLQALASAVLAAEGFEVTTASDGLEALARFEADPPDLLLTDFDMPGLNGLELIQRLRAKALASYIPMVMFTGGGRPGLLQESLEAGAIEFITKPFEPEELRCRVNALAEMVVLHRDVEEAKARDDEELSIAKHVMGRLLEPGRLAMPTTFCMETLPTKRINGDACTWRMGLPDVHYGLICDATGHGLTAGISTIPVVEAFLSMAGRNIPLDSIYREVNQKLRRMLPTGRFVCMGLVRLDAANGQLSFLNAGMPTAMLWRQFDGSIRSLPSRSLPAGVLVTHEAVPVEEMEAKPGDRLFFFSDGLHDLFEDDARVEALLAEGAQRPFAEHCDAIRAAIAREAGDAAEQLDDVTWCLWEVPTPALALPQRTPEHTVARELLERGMALSVEIHPVLHSLPDLIPDLMSMIAHTHMGPGDAATLALLLTEALTNALDHGILGLDSALKDSGFEAYEQERRSRLATLQDGRMTASFQLWNHRATGRVLEVEVSVEDSGPGFDWRAWQGRLMDPKRPSGRGLGLIQALARDLTFNEAGNRVSFRMPCG